MRMRAKRRQSAADSACVDTAGGNPRRLAGLQDQVGDLLDVRLFLNPELNEEVAVRPDGMISTTLAEDIPAANRTPAEISADLRERYKATLRDPRISVIVHSFAPNRIYVAGEVTNPANSSPSAPTSPSARPSRGPAASS